MKNFERYLIVFLAIMGTGCAVQSRMGAGMDFMAVAKTTAPCYEHLRKNPKYAELHRRLAVDTGAMPTEDQLADTETPSPQMVQLGMEWYAENEACNQFTLEAFGSMDPVFGATVAGWLTEVTDIMNDTVSNNPTYGHINTRIKHLVERKRSDTREWIIAESNRRQAEARQTMSDAFDAFSDVAMNVLDAAVQVLDARQSAIDQAQRAYYVRVPTYRQVKITRTVCHLQGKKVVCRQEG